MADKHNTLPKSTRRHVKLDNANLYLEPHNYRIYYVNIELRHQYGIAVAESQTFLRAKSSQRRRARRNGCFRRLILFPGRTQTRWKNHGNSRGLRV